MVTEKIIDTILIIIFVISFCKGYNCGIFKILSQTLSWICGLILCRPLSVIIQNVWGNSFNQMFYAALSSLDITSIDFSSDILQSGAEMSVKFVAEKLSSVLCILLAFALISMCADIVFHAFALTEHIYIVEIISKILGGVSQCFLLITAIWIFDIIGDILGIMNSPFMVHFMEILDKSKIFQYCTQYNPLYYFIRKY